MMRKKLTIVSMLLLSTLLVLYSSFSRPTKYDECQFDAIIFDEKNMPMEWQNDLIIESPILETLGAKRSYRVMIKNREQTVSYALYDYSNIILARLNLLINEEIFFPSELKDWIELDALRGMPMNTHQMHVKYGHSRDKYLTDMFSAILIYGSYVSNVNMSIDEYNEDSLGEFKSILLRIDDLFANCQQEGS